jgi:GNAT superfamily N-acetyltransferase
MTDHFRIRYMTVGDIAAGLRLGRQNGWNQVEADWRRFLAMQPDGCFVADLDGTVLGTACGFIFGRVAWVAMVLVDVAHRNRGIGTALTRHVLDFLDAREIPSIRLDATPLGRTIYEKLGFTAEYELVRYEGMLPQGNVVAGVISAAPEDLPDICRLDERITGADRRKFLERIYAETPEAVHVLRGHNGILGFTCARNGARAVQLGPCLAKPQAFPLLLADLFQRHAGRYIFVDIPVSQTQAMALAAGKGLTVQRRLLRMGRGRHVAERMECLWASAGPEKG